MTDDKQDPSVVAWRYRVSEHQLNWNYWGGANRPNVVSGLTPVIADPLSLTSDLTAMKAELEEAKKERDEALERVDELEAQGEAVSADFEKECWVAMRSLLNLCYFDWRDVDPGDGVTADDAREYIATTINEIELAEKRNLARAEAAEQGRDDLREELKQLREKNAPSA